MTPETHWISCAERMPTEADADKHDKVLALFNNGVADSIHWGTATSYLPCMTHWMRIPAPPKPVVKTQEQKNNEALLGWLKPLPYINPTTSEVWHAACAYKSKEIGDRLGEIIATGSQITTFNNVILCSEALEDVKQLERELTEGAK